MVPGYWYGGGCVVRIVSPDTKNEFTAAVGGAQLQAVRDMENILHSLPILKRRQVNRYCHF